MKRRCRHGHVHPPVRVVANTELVVFRVSRFYHCPDCVAVRDEGSWVEFSDILQARHAGHASPCRACFPKIIPSRKIAESILGRHAR